MVVFILTVSRFFLTPIPAPPTDNSKHTYHVNIANVILMDRTACDGFHEGKMLAKGSNISLNSPQSPTEQKSTPESEVQGQSRLQLYIPEALVSQRTGFVG